MKANIGQKLLPQTTRRLRVGMTARRIAALEEIAGLSPSLINHNRGIDLNSIIDERTEHLAPSETEPRSYQNVFEELRQYGGLRNLSLAYDRDFNTPLGLRNFYRILTDISSFKGPFAAAEIALALTYLIAIKEVNIIKVGRFPERVAIWRVGEELEGVLDKETINIPVSLSDWLALNYFAKIRAVKEKDKYQGNAGQRLFIRELKDEGRITNTNLQAIFKAIHPDFRKELGWAVIEMYLNESERLKLPDNQLVKEKIAMINSLKPEDIDHKEGKELGFFLDEITRDILNPAVPMTLDEFLKLRINGELQTPVIYDQDIKIFGYKINLYRNSRSPDTLTGYAQTVKLALEAMLRHYLGEIKILGFKGRVYPRAVLEISKSELGPEAIRINTSVSNWMVLNYFAEEMALKNKTRYAGFAGLFINELYEQGRISTGYSSDIYYAINPEYRRELGWSYSLKRSELEEIASSMGKNLDTLTSRERDTLEKISQIYPSRQLSSYLNITKELGLKMLMESGLSLGQLGKIVENLSNWRDLFGNYQEIKGLSGKLAEILTVKSPGPGKTDTTPLKITQLRELDSEINAKLGLVNEVIMERLSEPNRFKARINRAESSQKELLQFLRAVSQFSQGRKGELQEVMTVIEKANNITTYVFKYRENELRFSLQPYKNREFEASILITLTDQEGNDFTFGLYQDKISLYSDNLDEVFDWSDRSNENRNLPLGLTRLKKEEFARLVYLLDTAIKNIYPR